MKWVELVGIVLAICGIIGIGYLLNWAGKVCNVLRSFWGRPRLGVKCYELGIRQIWAERKDASPITERLFGGRGARGPRHVEMMGQSLAWLKDRGDKPLKEVLDAGCRFDFLLVDPGSEVMKMRTVQENPGLRSESEGFIEWVKRSFATYETQIEVRVHRMGPTMGITVVDEDILYVAPYAMTRRTHDMPMLMVKSGGRLFDTFRNEFRTVWSRGRRVFPAPSGEGGN